MELTPNKRKKFVLLITILLIIFFGSFISDFISKNEIEGNYASSKHEIYSGNDEPGQEPFGSPDGDFTQDITQNVTDRDIENLDKLYKGSKAASDYKLALLSIYNRPYRGETVDEYIQYLDEGLPFFYEASATFANALYSETNISREHPEIYPERHMYWNNLTQSIKVDCQEAYDNGIYRDGVSDRVALARAKIMEYIYLSMNMSIMAYDAYGDSYQEDMPDFDESPFIKAESKFTRKFFE